MIWNFHGYFGILFKMIFTLSLGSSFLFFFLSIFISDLNF